MIVEEDVQKQEELLEVPCRGTEGEGRVLLEHRGSEVKQSRQARERPWL